MRALAVVFVVLASVFAWTACDETTEPDCRTEQCDVVVDGGAPLQDGAALFDTGFVDPNPPPFDAGTTPPPTCKGLFELCAGDECCSPNTCTNGTCR